MDSTLKMEAESCTSVTHKSSYEVLVKKQEQTRQSLSQHCSSDDSALLQCYIMFTGEYLPKDIYIYIYFNFSQSTPIFLLYIMFTYGRTMSHYEG